MDHIINDIVEELTEAVYYGVEAELLRDIPEEYTEELKKAYYAYLHTRYEVVTIPVYKAAFIRAEITNSIYTLRNFTPIMKLAVYLYDKKPEIVLSLLCEIRESGIKMPDKRKGLYLRDVIAEVYRQVEAELLRGVERKYVHKLSAAFYQYLTERYNHTAIPEDRITYVSVEANGFLFSLRESGVEMKLQKYIRDEAYEELQTLLEEVRAYAERKLKYGIVVPASEVLPLIQHIEECSEDIFDFNRERARKDTALSHMLFGYLCGSKDSGKEETE